MNSKTYWQTRQHEREAKAYSNILEVEKEYKEALERAKLNINKQISYIGSKYMKENQLSHAEAVKLLTGEDLKIWRKDLHEYMKEYKALKPNSLEAKKLWLEIETLSARSRISHLDALRVQVDMELAKVAGEMTTKVGHSLSGTYGETYKSVVADLGIKSMFVDDRVKEVLDRPWSGANYSARLWGNTERLAQVVKQDITTSLIQGVNLKTMTKRVSERLDGAKRNDVERLLRTEVNYVMNQATLDGYKDAKVEKYEFDATLDSRTSQICASLNGDTFELDKAAVGVNYPPMHPRCRSTTSPVIDFEALGKRVAEERAEKETEENYLKEERKRSIISIEVDEMTPCLRKLKDDTIVETEIKEIKYQKGIFEGWLFDWSKTEKKGYQILGLYADGDERLQGAISIRPNKGNLTMEIDIAESAPFNREYKRKESTKEYSGVGAHLFAEACKRSFDLGYEGYVEFVAKTNLVEYYREKLGAKSIDYQRMYIPTNSAKQLIEKYYGGGEI